jgi:alkylation response protein AidB-like acyl-CoA dehydrogenase
MTTIAEGEDLLATVQAVAPLITAHADATEHDRCLAAPVVQALRDAGLYGLYIPHSLGGREANVETAASVVEAVARVDGATGWNVMLTADACVLSGFVCTAAARAVFAGPPLPVVAGALNPLGRCRSADGGYRVSGRWPFGSGCQQADWFIGGSTLVDEDGPIRRPNGLPETRLLLIPAADVEIIDTWHVAGLRGTGSHDWTVHDLFVPEDRAVVLDPEAPYEPGPLYAFPLFGTLAISKAAVALGIARHAIDALTALAQAKTPTGQASLLRESAAVQADVARAEALVRAARAFLHATIRAVWDRVVAGEKPTLEQRALLRLAAVDGAARAAQAVDLMYNAGGATSIYASSSLERCFRDVHVVTAHIMVQAQGYETAGKVLVGLPPGTPVL